MQKRMKHSNNCFDVHIHSITLTNAYLINVTTYLKKNSFYKCLVVFRAKHNLALQHLLISIVINIYKL